MEYVRDFVYNNEDNLPPSWWSTYDDAPMMPNHGSGLGYFSQASHLQALPPLPGSELPWQAVNTCTPSSYLESSHNNYCSHRASENTGCSNHILPTVDPLYKYMTKPFTSEQAVNEMNPYAIKAEYHSASPTVAPEWSLEQVEEALMTLDLPLLPHVEDEGWVGHLAHSVEPRHYGMVEHAAHKPRHPNLHEPENRGISAPPFTAYGPMPSYLDSRATGFGEVLGTTPFVIRSTSALPWPINAPVANGSMDPFDPGLYYLPDNDTVNYESHSRASRPRLARDLPRNRQTLPRMGPRDSRGDQLLLDLRASGMSYKDIKEQYGFAEAESTLRGRYRALIKAPSQRVRQPPWPESAVEALIEGVHLFTSSQDTSNKTPWKKIAEWMERERGCYGYCATTIKKKYMRVLGTETLLRG